MKFELTDRYVRSIEPPEKGRIEISDTKRPGLKLRVSSRGRFSWLVQKRVKGGRQIGVTLGQYPAIGLAEARRQTIQIIAEADAGRDVMEERRQVRAEAERIERETLSVREALSFYNDLHLKTLSDGSERHRQLLAAFGTKLDAPLTSLTMADCQRAIDEKLRPNKLVMANRVRSAIRHFTSWCFSRGHLSADIAVALPKAAREAARDIVLSVEEVRQIFDVCTSLGRPWGALVRLQILTGQREGEIRELRWEEVDLDARTITKAGAQTKNGKPHITHLSEPALAILNELNAARIEEVPWVFPGRTPEKPVWHNSKVKIRLSEALGDDFRQDWRLHDLRTAMASALCERGESEQIVDRILNHSAVGSAPSAVARVYQRSDLLPQRAKALDTWGRLVCEGDAAAEVIQLNA